MRPTCLAVALVLLASVRLLQAADPPLMPTMEEVQQAYDEQKYPDVIKKVAQVMARKSATGAELDRGKLLALKGESHLRLKQGALAADAFNAASRETASETDSATYAGTAILVRRSSGGQYTPKQPTTKPVGTARPPKPEPISILEPDSRKQALAALFNDESKAVLAKTESLKRQTSLPPLMDGIKQVADLRTLELAATGADPACQQILAGLGQHANELMAKAIKSMSETVDKIAKQASETSVSYRDRSDGSRDTITSKRGLTSVDQTNLRDVISTCNSIMAAGQELGKALKAESSLFASVTQDASALGAHANEVLNADYKPITNNSRTPVTPGTIRPTPPPYR